MSKLLAGTTLNYQFCSNGKGIRLEPNMSDSSGLCFFDVFWFWSQESSKDQTRHLGDTQVSVLCFGVEVQTILVAKPSTS